jgi:outer membrane protein assembly factor BamB
VRTGLRFAPLCRRAARPGRRRPRRLRGAALAAALLALAALAGCRTRSDWISFRGQQGRGATSNAVNPPLAVKWKLELQVGAEPTYAFNNPVVQGDTLYFGSTDGNFYALDIKSGYMRWVFKTSGAINSVPYADGANVYFGNNAGKVYAVSQKDGKEVWSFQTDSTVQSTIVGYKDYVLFASDGGTAYFLGRDGRERFTLPNPVWHYNAFQVYDDVVYFAPAPPSRPHAFGAFDLRQREYLWVLDTDLFQSIWYSFPALRGDNLFFATADLGGNYWRLDYYAFRRRTGQRVWSYEDESDWGNLPVDAEALFARNMRLLDFMAPAVWRNLVIYASGDTAVRAFRAGSGRLAWKRTFDQVTSSSVTVAGDRLYFGLRGDDSPYGGGRPARLVCLSARNGRLLWQMDVEGSLLSAPVIAGKWMVFGTDRNFFYVLEQVF